MRLPGIVVAFIICIVLPLTTARADEDVSLAYRGINLNGHVALAEGKTLADGAVLLVHGTLAHNGMEIIQTMQRVLSERGINSLAISLSYGVDNRKGMYDCARPHTHLHTEPLDEMGAWLDWLKEQGAKKVALMGHSRGGNHSAWFAAERLDPVIEKVVLLAPGTWDEESAAKSYEKNTGTPLADMLARANAMIAAGKGDEMIENVDFLYCRGTSASAAAFVSIYAPDPRFHTPNLLAAIKVPVLVVVGTADTVVPDLIDAVEPTADGDHVRLTVIDDADHFFLDFYAEDAGDAIAEFLAWEPN
ncbi:MAG: alpha/beta fold hydrolase [Hyphomicrobiales bacterium]|nr:alpha/beta fold hydrolase [Hyphomicrobiales bacterium]